MVVRRIVGVFAHPDDESLIAGGTLARYVAEGALATVLTCTGGEAGESSDAAVAAPRLGDVRREELREACRRLGVQRLELLDYRDSGIPERRDPLSLAAAPIDAVAGAIRAVLAREHPDIVITHDPTGGYGHPDHVRISAATALAVRALRSTPSLWYGVLPRRVVDEFASAFAAAGLRAKGRAAAAGADMDRDAGVPDGSVTASIDVSRHVRAKQSAVSAHGTQMNGHILFQLPEPVLAHLWREEHFARGGVRAGAAIVRDLFDQA